MAKKKSKKPNNSTQRKPNTAAVSVSGEQSPTTPIASETEYAVSENLAVNASAEQGVTVDEEQTLSSDGAQQTESVKDDTQPDETDEQSGAVDDVQAEQNTPPNVEQLKTRRWLTYVIAAGVLAVLTLLMGILFNGYSAGDAKTLVGAWSSAFSVPGIICLGVGLLIWCSNEGAFDMLSYGVRSFFRLFRKDVKDRKYGDYYGYQQARKDRKKPFLYMIAVGGAYLLVGIILIVIYSQLP